MSIRKVARMGHPVLREKTKKINPKEIKSAEIKTLIQDLVDTMEEYGGIGIAAPQIHESKAVAIIRMDTGSETYKDANGEPITVFINPEIKVIDEKTQECWEGCLSVPGLRGLVARPRKVQVVYLDETSEEQELTIDGFGATVVQHELDHLSGTLYVDKIADKTKLMFEEEYIKYHQSDDSPEVD
jgi:peptide deformylase